MEIASIDQLIALWPKGTFRLKAGGREYEAPCPFCPAEPDSLYETINGRPISFTGGDRLFRRPNGTFGCRVCEAAGRGQGRSNKGFYTIRAIAERFGFSVSTTFSHVSQEDLKPSKPIHSLWYTGQVEDAHQKVKYDFWYGKYGWSKETVDEFKLGYGELYDWHGPAHLIPMNDVRRPDQEPLEGWYIAARNDHPSAPKVKSPGSNTGFFWLIQRDPSDKTVIMAESPNENITHSVLGYKNTFAAFASGIIDREMVAWLWEQGYRHMIIAGDNDSAGQKFIEHLGTWAYDVGFDTIEYPQWPSSCPAKCDTSDLYKDNESNAVATRAQFESWLVDFTPVPAPEIPIDLDDEDREIFPREVLRGSGPDSVYGRIVRFRETYDRDRPFGKGKMHISAPPPGTGKTQAMIRDVEDQAELYLVQREIERLAKEQELADLEKELVAETDEKEREEFLKKIQQVRWTLESWSVTAYAWYGQYKQQWKGLEHFGAKKHLWFNFEARNETNCANFEIAQKLGENNHNNGNYCKSACPLRDACRQKGYLAQEEERRKYPITFFRHNNIFMTISSDYPKGIVIDENPTRLMEAHLEIKPNDLNPFDLKREETLEDNYTYCILKDLMTAIRQSMSYNAGAKDGNPEYRLSGADFFRLVDRQLRASGMTIEQMLEPLDTETLEEYQPNFYGGDKRFIKLRCVPDLIRVMQHELPHFTKDNHHQRPSCIHLISGKLFVFAQERVRIPSAIPLYVLDGTPLPELYIAMFNREADVFRPDMVNANCQTIVLGGGDFPKSTFNSEVGRYLQKRKQQAKKIVAKSDPNNPIDVESLPHSAEAYQSQMLQDAIQLIVGVAELHKQLLVVSYKDMKQILKELITLEYPKLTKKLAWGHYGALRGTNEYEDYEAVLLIGAYRIPYNSAYLYISMWASLLGREEPLDPTLIKRKKKYHGTDEVGELISFNSDFARRYIEALETADAIQAYGRIRGHSSDAKKTIYVAAKRPLTRHTTKVIKRIEFIKQFVVTVEKVQKQFIIDQMLNNFDLFGEYRKPTFRQITQACGGSNSSIKKILAEIDASGMFPTKEKA